MRRRFLALLGALDEVFDVLREGGGAIGGQLKRVSSNRRAGTPAAAIRVLPVPQYLQPWRCWKEKFTVSLFPFLPNKIFIILIILIFLEFFQVH